jgi:phage tail sheath protein FI
MVDLISPGVQVKEKDLTTTVRAEPTSIGGFCGIFAQGPIDEVITIDSESTLVNVFGKPNATNYQYWFSAASFLAYSNTLKVVRVAPTGAVNACVSGTALLIKNTTHYSDGDGTTGPYGGGQADVGQWAARTAGEWGNSLKVSMCTSAAAYYESAKTTVDANAAAAATTITMVSATGFFAGDIVYFGEADGQKYKISSISSNDLTIVRYPTTTATGLASAITATTSVRRWWEFYEQFSGAPGTSTYATDRSSSGDEMHIIVVDEDGDITGVAGEIVEKWEKVSKASDAKTDDGAGNYYVDVIYDGSSYIYWMDHAVASSSDWGSTAAVAGAFVTATNIVQTDSLVSGVGSAVAPTEGQRQLAYLKAFSDPDTEDVNLLISGPSSVDNAGATTHGVFMTDLVGKRKDCMAFISADQSDVVNIAQSYTQTTNTEGFFDALGSSSYVAYDSGYTKMFDKYNDLYRWIPLNGHIAGLCAHTDAVEDAWWSPAGMNRGQIRSSISLAHNPKQTERDILYRARVNSVVTFPGEGTMLFGDKTALNKNSAFSRINVRRLFLVIEEAIKVAARTVLFEFNDEFTRSNFKAMVDPFLRDIQARRGITDFLTVCDETNNTGQVIDNNEFRADFYIKPARSINFVTLTFIATRTGVDFDEIVGRA